MRLHFATAADDPYGLPLAVMLTSLVRHLPPDVPATLHVLDHGIRAATRERVRGCVRRLRPSADVTFHPIDDDALSGFVTTLHFSPATFARLLLPNLLPDVRRLVYVDADACVQGDLSSLFTLDLQGCPIAAVRDFHVQRMGNLSGGRFAGRFGEPDDPYFNAGFMVIDLDAWRREAVHTRAAELLRTTLKGAEYVDQDGLNAVLHGRWRPLEETWNVQVNMLTEPQYMEGGKYKTFVQAVGDDLLVNGRVLHFTGSNKPWLRRSWPAVRSAYGRALADSGWYPSPIRPEALAWRFGWWKRTIGHGWRAWKGRASPQQDPLARTAASGPGGALNAVP